tara:strand:- start:282 stop:509 length:228 start_codon:yes stop_codon:yes gene_type:complete
MKTPTGSFYLSKRWLWKMSHSWLGYMGDHTYRKTVDVYENGDELYKIVIQNLTEKEHQIYLDKLDEAKVEFEEDE